MKGALKVGVYFDGFFVGYANNYYRHIHSRRQPLDIPGIVQFLKQKASELLEEEIFVSEAHLFKGRLAEVDSAERLQHERIFDSILARHGIFLHYFPIFRGLEKGVDVWLSLEAFESAVSRKLDAVILVAGDTDYLPLLWKLRSNGVLSIVAGWEYSYVDQEQGQRTCVVSKLLKENADFYLNLAEIVDSEEEDSDLIELIFHTKNGESLEERYEGYLNSLKDSYGFVSSPQLGKSLFFHASDLENATFASLKDGLKVEFSVENGPRGEKASKIKVIGEA